MVVKEEETIIFSRQAVEETFIEGIQEEDNLKSAKAKMDEVAEENKKLKLTLSQMMKNYQSLKMSFDDIFKQDDRPIKVQGSSPKPDESEDKSEVVCRLSLGSISGEDSKKQEKKINQENKHLKELVKADGLELGLDHKFHLCDSGDVTKNSSSENNSFDELKEEEIEAKGSFKSLKTARSATSDEILELNPVKKPRVSVRAVCDTQTMNDGCQWRKYGQKTAKGNPCPRAYYRCTASTSCPVRKQVQRCADNMAILITTYEGTHNHPLPPSAITMASATTSAAAMLNCGSSTSSPPSQGVFSTSSATASNFNTFNFSSTNSTLTSPYTSLPRTSISTSQSHPTVILDLTPPSHTAIPYNKYNHSSSLFNSSTPRSSSTCLNFSSAPYSDSGSLGIYKTPFHNESHASPCSQPYVYNKNVQEDVLSIDGIGAAAKAITRDPKFQTALATAVASLIGNGGDINSVQESNSGQSLRWGENFGLNFSQPSSRNGVTACATSYLSKYLETLNPQQK